MIDIITPVYNQFVFTKQFILDLSMMRGTGINIHIIDNGSTDETKHVEEKIPLKCDPVFKILKNTSNLGFSRASNQGYASSKEDVVLFLNNDIRILHTNMESWHVSILDVLEEFPDAIVGPTGGYVDESTYDFRYHTQDPDQKFNYLSGWCLAGRRSTFEKLKEDLGYIDGPHGSYGPFWLETGSYFEDTYMGFQCRRMGVPQKLIKVDAVHIGSITSGSMGISRMYSSAKAQFRRKMEKEKADGRF